MSSLLPYLLSELQSLAVDEAMQPSRSRPRPTSRPCHGLCHCRSDVDDYVLRCLRPNAMHPLRSLRYPEPDTLLVLRPRQPAVPTSPAVPAPKDDGKGLHIDLDVQQFRPEELSVQVLRDEGFVVIEGKHEEREDEHGFVQRQFSRRYKLPADVDADAITSRLSSDGVLQISAPRKQDEVPVNPSLRHVPISHTNQPAVHDVPDVHDNASLQDAVVENSEAEDKRQENDS